MTAAGALGRNDRQTGRWIAAEVRQKASRDGKLPARPGDGALVEVSAEYQNDGIVEHTDRFPVVVEGGISKSSALPRRRDRLPVADDDPDMVRNRPVATELVVDVRADRKHQHERHGHGLQEHVLNVTAPALGCCWRR